jgi:flagellin-like hook-associated protein FlgL
LPVISRNEFALVFEQNQQNICPVHKSRLASGKRIYTAADDPLV